MAGEFRTISVALVLNGQQFETKLRAQSAELRAFEAQATRSGKGAAGGLNETAKSADSMGFSVKSALGNFAAFTGAQLTVQGLGLAFRAFVGETVQFDANMRNVNSLAQLSEASLGRLSDQVLDLASSGDFLQSATDISAGLYDLTSSGFGPANGGLEVLTASLTSASAGLTDTATAVKGTTATLNAYGLGADQAAHVSNVLFGTVNRGVITYEELAGQIGDVVGIAAAAKVPIEDVGAAIATMTLSGISGAEATTSLNRVIQSLIDPSDEMATVLHQLGYESGAQALEADGLAGVMERLRGATGGNVESLTQLFPEIRAARGAFALMSADGRTYAEVSEYMTTVDRDQGEAKRALAEQMKGLGAEATVAWHKFQAGAIDAATKAMPYVKDGLHGIEDAASSLWSVLVDAGERAEPALAVTADALADIWSAVVGVAEAGAPLAQMLGGAAFITSLTLLQGVAEALSLVAGFLESNATLVSMLITAWLGFKAAELAVSGATAAVKLFDAAGVALFDRLGRGADFSTFATTADKAGTATRGLTGDVSGMTVAGGLLAGALTGASVAMQVLASNSAHAREEVSSFVGGLKIDRNDPRSIARGLDEINTQQQRLLGTAEQSNWRAIGQNLTFWTNNNIDTSRKAVEAYSKESEELSKLALAEFGNVRSIQHYTGASFDQVIAKAQELNVDVSKAFADTPERGQLIAALKEVGRQATDAGISHQEMATMDAEALQAAVDQWHKYRDAVQSALDSHDDVIAGTSKLIGPDVAARKLTDMATAQGSLNDALDGQAQAQDRINAATPENPVTAEDLQSLADANDKVAEARQKLSDTETAASHSDIDSIRDWYRETLTTTQQFSDNINKAIQEGYDPGLIARVLQAGPEQAGPFLAAIVSDQGQVYRDEINQAEKAITDMQARIVAQARLVNKATQSPTDALVKDLPKASEIQLRLSADPLISSSDIAAQMGITQQELTRIADEYGITLPVVPTVPPGTPPPAVPPINVHAIADVGDAEAALDLLGRDRFPLLAAILDQWRADRAAGDLDAVARDRAAFMQAVASTQPAESNLNVTARPREVPFVAVIDLVALAAGQRILDELALRHTAAVAPAINDYVTGHGANRWGGLMAPDGAGGMVRAFAGGGMFPQIGQRGVTRVWNEPATGVEAYVPQRGDYLRAMTTLRTAAGWYGLDVVDSKRLTHFASGGMLASLGHAAPAVPSSFRSVSGGGTFVDQRSIQVVVPNLPASATLRDVERIVNVSVSRALDEHDRGQLQRSRR